ncbi:MAG: S41 family peptidase [Candidatus Magasanikbacteria bacterium]|nr:S41 family peptidase [Candidatus Magasanikbacteria bacterium]
MQTEINPIKQRAHKYAGIYFTAIMAIALFGLGVVAGQAMDSKRLISQAAENSTFSTSIINVDRNQNNSKQVDFQQFWQVWDKVKRKYAKQPVKDSDLFYGAMQGMVAGLGDPYTVYFPPKEAEDFNKSLDGKFSGIGAEIGVKNNQLLVIAPLPGTPAEKAGLLPGDKIYAIDKVVSISMDSNTAVEKIRGQEGTNVTLTIMRAGFSKPKDFVITRAQINVPSVMFLVKNKNVAYIRIMQFNQNTVPEFDKAIKQIQDKKLSKLIIDLRNDPGGYLDAAVSVASEWIPEGKIVSEKFSNGDNNDHNTIGEHRLQDIKTVVLVNSGSASASEILAGALQDTKKATIVGEKSFGKGSVQDYETLSDGSALKVTVAEWYTPNGKNINQQGIEPEVTVKEEWAKEKVGEDVMLQKALSVFVAKPVAKPAVQK